MKKFLDAMSWICVGLGCIAGVLFGVANAVGIADPRLQVFVSTYGDYIIYGSLFLSLIAIVISDRIPKQTTLSS